MPSFVTSNLRRSPVCFPASHAEVGPTYPTRVPLPRAICKPCRSDSDPSEPSQMHAPLAPVVSTAAHSTLEGDMFPFTYYSGPELPDPPEPSRVQSVSVSIRCAFLLELCQATGKDTPHLSEGMFRWQPLSLGDAAIQGAWVHTLLAWTARCKIKCRFSTAGFSVCCASSPSYFAPVATSRAGCFSLALEQQWALRGNLQRAIKVQRCSERQAWGHTESGALGRRLTDHPDVRGRPRPHFRPPQGSASLSPNTTYTKPTGSTWLTASQHPPVETRGLGAGGLMVVNICSLFFSSLFPFFAVPHFGQLCAVFQSNSTTSQGTLIKSLVNRVNALKRLRYELSSSLSLVSTGPPYPADDSHHT